MLEQAILDPNGPDITVDEARLRASIRVVTNADVTEAEVEEGCAGGTHGRTLVRFEVKTPNNGPGDLNFGAVSCKSTSTQPECQNVDCSLNSACCCNGASTCTASSNPSAGKFFEYACAHRHIHFKSFADYRLLNAQGSVAATGHKQSFCLMDLAAANGDGSCPAFNHFSCGNQGIHAGCADIYSSSLPCSFVDVTAVAGGDYTLEVKLDPLDAINESNEGNNVVRVPVHIESSDPPVPPPPIAQNPLYLVRKGLGSENDANTYYGKNIQGFIPRGMTLALFKAQFIDGRPLNTALYRNTNELGSWREMTCTTTVGRGVGGCMVTDWQGPTDRDAGLANKGTAAMNVSPDGFARFYVFDANGVISPNAVLDSEGAKFLPQVCTVCHGGEYRSTVPTGEMGSVFRELEPSLLQPRPGITQQQAELEWFRLNQSIRSANEAIRSETDGAPFGTDRAKANILSYLKDIYTQADPPVSRSVKDDAHVPATWKDGATPELASAKAEMWKQVVNPYCMSCHRSSSLDYNSYAAFQVVSAIQDGQPLIKSYISINTSDPNRTRLPFMPQGKLQWTNLANDATALIAVDRWVTEASRPDPVCPGGSVEQEPNDKTSEANAIEGTKCGSVAASDWDFYSWSVAASGVPVSVGVEASGDAEVRLYYKVQGNIRRIREGTSTLISTTSTGATTYIARVSSPSRASQTYKVKVTR